MKWKTPPPHITIIIWGSFILPLWAFSADFPGCPTETFQTEVVSPINSSKRILCSKKTSSGFHKHGPEWIFDYQGKLIQKNTFKNDELVSSVEMKAGPDKAQNFEAKNKNDNDNDDKDMEKTDENVSIQKDYSFIKTIMHETLQLWHPLKRPIRERIAVGGFETRSCDVNDYTLTRFYKNEIESFDLDLSYSRRCSFRGTHQLIWGRPQKVTLKLRDMRDFVEVEMQLSLFKSFKTEGDKKLHRVQTQIKQAVLRTETGGLTFEADYMISIDLDERKALKGHGGELRILEFDSKKIDITHPLNLNIVELP